MPVHLTVTEHISRASRVIKGPNNGFSCADRNNARSNTVKPEGKGGGVGKEATNLLEEGLVEGLGLLPLLLGQLSTQGL